MNVIAVNGSPRKDANTATLLKKTLEGAVSRGAETELIHLYDLDFKGCKSCFACKRIGGASYGRCALRDDITPILERIEKADAVVFGSPIYFGEVTGEMRSFLERLLFPYLVYDKSYSTLFPRKIRTGFIYTMNVPKTIMDQTGYAERLKQTEGAITRTLGPVEIVYSNDTYQFDDYSKYQVTSFSEQAKAKVRKEQFPIDCQNAFELGVKLTSIE